MKKIINLPLTYNIKTGVYVATIKSSYFGIPISVTIEDINQRAVHVDRIAASMPLVYKHDQVMVFITNNREVIITNKVFSTKELITCEKFTLGSQLNISDDGKLHISSSEIKIKSSGELNLKGKVINLN